MAKTSDDLKFLHDKFNIGADDIWDCHGTWVILHRSCESIATQLGIQFNEPKVLFANEKDIAILVTGNLGKESEWSIGEAAPANNKNSYPWAMAEKRAKDRVILKLAKLSEHGFHSDIETDDPKMMQDESEEAKGRHKRLLKMLANEIDRCSSIRALRSLYMNAPDERRLELVNEFEMKAEAFGEPLEGKDIIGGNNG